MSENTLEFSEILIKIYTGILKEINVLQAVGFFMSNCINACAKLYSTSAHILKHYSTVLRHYSKAIV